MSYTFDHIESLIVRSLEGGITPAEQEELQSWLEEDDANRRYYSELQKTWDLTGTADADIAPDIEANWASFNSKLQTNISSQPTGIVRSFRWYALRAAAAVLLLGGASTAWYMLNAPRQITVQTAANETNIIVLPDGTKAFINKNSSLRYASNFNKGERTIHLEGEAYFDVVKDEAHPFVVYTSRTRTQVLGTTFDVKAYAVQPVEVFVLSGKVAVSDQEKESKEVVLTEGRKVTLGKDQQLAEDAISNRDFIAWKDNIMVFNDEPIRNVIRKVEALYGVKIVAEESVADYSIKTRITPDEPLEQILDVIAASASASWEKEGNVYKLNRK
ncbi:FecR family protein [Chitinophaga ginsengisoli]|uniref:FecR family protein n=1 Tax=Chitinophaga ginsengisoli TaxID=363837 RepID=A0A2P8GPP4_9BACT|nr:FecR family protein [Chitinophaga ginsengisoli]PSL35940.1 FecR family protein [Chitinophaga ginsengisoli]